MKKILLIFLCIFIGLVFFTCKNVVSNNKSKSTFNISNTSLLGTKEISFYVNKGTNSVDFDCQISIEKGSVILNIISFDNQKIYTNTFTNVNNKKFKVNLNNLISENYYKIVLESSVSINVNLIMESETILTKETEKPHFPSII